MYYFKICVLLYISDSDVSIRRFIVIFHELRNVMTIFYSICLLIYYPETSWFARFQLNTIYRLNWDVIFYGENTHIINSVLVFRREIRSKNSNRYAITVWKWMLTSIYIPYQINRGIILLDVFWHYRTVHKKLHTYIY